jgi:hypothetical protein
MAGRPSERVVWLVEEWGLSYNAFISERPQRNCCLFKDLQPCYADVFSGANRQPSNGRIRCYY